MVFVHVEAAIRVADGGQTGARAELPGRVVLRVDYETLVVATAEAERARPERIDAPALAPGQSWTFAARDAVRQPFGAWVFSARPLADHEDVEALHADPLAAVLVVPPDATLTLRARLPGDRFSPRGMGGRSQKVKDMMNAMRVPAVWRARVPLLLVGADLAWFVAPGSTGLRGRVADKYALRDVQELASRRIVVRWNRQT